MLTQILGNFPPHVHPLTLVCDPDQVLADETVRARLAERGFALLTASDPVSLRVELAHFGAWSAQRPLILITPRPLNQLPYDLWQQGHHVTLALHTFFPTLAYPVLQSLTPNQRWRLAQLPLPAQTLGRQASLDFVLQHLFGVTAETFTTAASLIAWLDDYHQREAMPPLLAERWLARAQTGGPLTQQWPLADWLHDREQFHAFVSEQWQQYVLRQSGQPLAESQAAYLLAFDQDIRLQDDLPRLVRSGAIQPVMLADATALPAWAQIGAHSSPADHAQQRADSLLASLAEQVSGAAGGRWEQWTAIAAAWAELTRWRYHPEQYLTEAQQAAYTARQGALDSAFRRWLRQGYAPLAGQIVPQPHHLYHVPHFMAYARRQGTGGRVALLVLDGLSLAAWSLLAASWRRRYPAWRWSERLLLAQIPSVTAVSRQALVSGQRPFEFAADLTHNRAESQQWAAFWTREDIPAAACAYEHLRLNEGRAPDSISSSRTQALCLIYNGFDDMVHAARLGLADVFASLRVWLKSETCQRLEALLAELLDRRYTVYLTSDHGHTEALGMGQPAEGVTVQSRSKRARLYSSENAARAVQAGYPQTVLWQTPGILPDDSWVLLPDDGNGRRLAFAPVDEQVVTHGGLSIDEMIVPFVQFVGQTVSLSSTTVSLSGTN
jgi:hypothetical protein